MIKNTDIFLREHGIKPSYQRKRIYEYLNEHRIHPTANDIYTALVGEIPTLSKATVYNTMNLFARCGLVDVIPIEGHEARFDPHPEAPHAHFRCTCCQKVYDVPLSFPEEAIEEALSQCQIDTFNINFTGVCKECLARNEA
ncbi:Fur family transcriptional regulator [Clostridiaceae bacterium JG1575]|nr:Fur family transcriptional regulator [Clostridiaceae bacterium JG1575]